MTLIRHYTVGRYATLPRSCNIVKVADMDLDKKLNGEVYFGKKVTLWYMLLLSMDFCRDS